MASDTQHSVQEKACKLCFSSSMLFVVGVQK